MLHGLGNIIENAADFAPAASRSRPAGAGRLQLLVEDDGPGFAPEIFERIGEPYVTSRPGITRWAKPRCPPAMPSPGNRAWGLGFFIAKTLMEQTGGSVQALNLQAAAPGWRYAGRGA